MLEGRLQNGEPVPDAAGRAGQIDDERLAEKDARQATSKQAVRSFRRSSRRGSPRQCPERSARAPTQSRPGVTSRGPTPVPPVVQHDQFSRASSSIASAIAALVGNDSRTTSKPSPVSNSSSASPLLSSRVPMSTPSETVEHSSLHAGSFVFSSSRTSVTAIESSMAFAMS